ncbi:hypothetical protein PUN28_019292 [Cardiocondyla obscurior]|uniref:Uncharacterized protein n=1 Tax=Cardiocondyla obscurior TaxID=286306 RepID=A0AAW2EEJ7_9HYME
MKRNGLVRNGKGNLDHMRGERGFAKASGNDGATAGISNECHKVMSSHVQRSCIPILHYYNRSTWTNTRLNKKAVPNARAPGQEESRKI